LHVTGSTMLPCCTDRHKLTFCVDVQLTAWLVICHRCVSATATSINKQSIADHVLNHFVILYILRVLYLNMFRRYFYGLIYFCRERFIE